MKPSFNLKNHVTHKNFRVFKRGFFTTVYLCIPLLVTSCAHIPADQNSLPQQDIARMQLAASIKLARDGWPDAQWWTAYGDSQLNSLIAQALKDSPTLETTAARIASAQAALTVNRAEQGVSIDLNANANRQRYSSTGLFPAPIGGSYYSEETLQVQARYEIDWWGKHRAQIAAALGDVNAQRADYAQAEQALAVAITQSYFNLQSGWAQLANMQSITAIQNALSSDKAKRIAHGVAAADEQHMAETQLSTINQNTTQLEARIARELEVLRALLGANSNVLSDLKPHSIPDIPHTIPSKLGIELLARRPDLQAARWRIEASLSRIEAAQAAFYPDINLMSYVGLDAVSLSHLLNVASRTLFIGPTVSLPLFDSNRLQARLGVARSERNELIADYNQRVFNAARDVAQAGISLQEVEKQLRQQAEATQATQALLRTARAKFKQGLADRSTVLAAELTVFKQKDASLQLQNQQFQTEVALVKTLGGGYRTGFPPSLHPSSK